MTNRLFNGQNQPIEGAVPLSGPPNRHLTGPNSQMIMPQRGWPGQQPPRYQPQRPRPGIILYLNSYLRSLTKKKASLIL